MYGMYIPTLGWCQGRQLIGIYDSHEVSGNHTMPAFGDPRCRCLPGQEELLRAPGACGGRRPDHSHANQRLRFMIRVNDGHGS